MATRVDAILVDEPNLRPLIRVPSGYFALVGLALVALVWGLGVYTYQWRHGLGVTGMTNPATWGLYIVNFVFFIGASAGGILVSSLAYAFGFERFRPIGRLAELGAIACLIPAPIFVLLDIGRPERFWRLLTNPQLESPLVWDVAIIGTYLALVMALGYFATRPDLVRCMDALPQRRGLYRALALGRTDVSPATLAREQRIVRVLAAAAIPAAVLLHSITAWILGVLKAQPGWHSALMAPLFIISATVSGVAITALAAIATRVFLHARIPDDAIRGLGRILLLAIPVLGYFLFAEMLTVMYAKEPAWVDVFHHMMFGQYAFLFWFDFFAGLIVPWFLLLGARPSVARIGVASALVALGVLAERWYIVISPLIGHAYLPDGIGAYFPTWVELSLMVGVWALGALIYLVLARVFPLVELDSRH